MAHYWYIAWLKNSFEKIKFYLTKNYGQTVPVKNSRIKFTKKKMYCIKETKLKFHDIFTKYFLCGIAYLNAINFVQNNQYQ